MNRRSLLLSTVGAGLAVGGLASPPRGLAALTATDDELAYANFGLAAEFLLQDFYAKAVAAKLAHGRAARDLARSGFNADEHAAALGRLLTDAGQTAAVADDFAFAWPAGTFAKSHAAATAGLEITRAVLGTYVGAAASISIAPYRALYASMAANLAQQVGSLSALAGGRVVGASFPPALDVETASNAIEAYLG